MSKQEIPYKIYLTENELPKEWYNVRADMRTDHRPLLNPATHEPVTLAELEPVFCTELAKQELNDKDAYIEIPAPVRDFYKMYRPSPLVRAYCLEKYLDTPAEIYYKFEGNNTSGSHKLNSAIAQAYYAKEQGLTGVTTETGAGQWGTALSMACGYFGLDLTVYMVRCSYEQKPQRRTLMNEAVEVALTKPDTRYVLGSVLNQVVLHQSVIGLESKTAMEKYDVYPDMVIGCAGGGSNLGGLMSPFMRDKLKGERHPYFIAVEPMSCPSLTRGKFAYDFCDTGKVTPLAKMYTLGSGFMPAPSHAGGLRYHGMSPILSQLYHDGYIDEARAVSQVDVFKAAIEFARVEGILPAPESAHAIKVTLDEARKCKETGEKKVILFGLTGTGYFDMISYERYMKGELNDAPPTDESLAEGEKDMPIV